MLAVAELSLLMPVYPPMMKVFPLPLLRVL